MPVLSLRISSFFFVADAVVRTVAISSDADTALAFRLGAGAAAPSLPFAVTSLMVVLVVLGGEGGRAYLGRNSAPRSRVRASRGTFGSAASAAPRGTRARVAQWWG